MLSCSRNMLCFSVKWMDLVWDSSSAVQPLNHSLFVVYMTVDLIKKSKKKISLLARDLWFSYIYSI